MLQTAMPNGNVKTPAAVNAASRIQAECDELARDVAATNWTDEMTSQVLSALTKTSASFRDAAVPQNQQARRAERLVLALDRLFIGKNNPRANAELDHIVKLAQSLPDFDPKEFAGALDKFSQSIN
jgi:hypothetical protein